MLLVVLVVVACDRDGDLASEVSQRNPPTLLLLLLSVTEAEARP